MNVQNYMQVGRVDGRINLVICAMLRASAWFSIVSLAGSAWAQKATLVFGEVRVQVLSDRIIRIEERGPKGFEDRTTFTIVRRPQAGGNVLEQKGKEGRLQVDDLLITVPDPKSMTGVTIRKAGRLVYRVPKELPTGTNLPSPANVPSAFAFADAPRIIPAGWGATPIPPNVRLTAEAAKNSGWDLDNPAKDLYVCLKGKEGLAGIRADVLALTGEVALPPLWAFGLWNSRYYPYTEQESYETIKKYRERGFPLDVFVVDTDWRVGASHGYAVNEKCFPDMRRFLARCKDLGIRTMFNDHPEPKSETALDPAEVNYRYEGLTSILDMGADSWWFDRNWWTTLRSPAKGLPKELWGMAVYHDAQQLFRPNERPMIMSNVPGIDNGIRAWDTPIQSHRYPIWWTGDTNASWSFLKSGVVNAVDAGVNNLMPYVNEDLGGHIGRPSNDLYTRFLQYGALSPITRIHCTAGQTRYPWEYGSQAEEIAKEYVRLRYRLLPLFYQAAREAYDTGLPILRRLDLEFPKLKQAARSDQYLLGNDILVAPVVESPFGEAKPIDPQLFQHPSPSGLQSGLKAEYFTNPKLEGQPQKTFTISKIGHWPELPTELGKDWPKENWSCRYTGVIAPAPETGLYTFSLTTDDGARLKVDGKTIIDEWRGQPPTLYYGQVKLQKGQTVPIELEYNQLGGGAWLKLEWTVAKEGVDPFVTTRKLWIPPGTWFNAWNDEKVVGPTEVTLNCPLWYTPIFVREGGAVLSVAEPKLGTIDSDWTKVSVDIFAAGGKSKQTRELYEDDGRSTLYKQGSWGRTPLTISISSREVRVQVGSRSGDFGPTERSWLVRFHVPLDKPIKTVTIDGNSVPFSILQKGRTPIGWQQMVPFKGLGQLPGGQTSGIVEVKLDRKPSSSTQEIVLSY